MKEQYWASRMEQLNEAELHKGEAYIVTQNVEYDKALARIRKETEAWYGRLAKNNDMTMAEARKLLSANELKEFHWDVQEYIKRGRENAVDQRWVKQLENASAKVHISRLEELETRVQQEVELLTAHRLKGTTDTLSDIYKDGYYKGIYEVQRGVGEGISFAGVDARQLDKVLAKPWTPDGRNFSNRIWDDKDKLLSELQTVLTQDLVQGAPSDKVIADFADRMSVSKRAAERLVLTEAAYFSGQSRLDGYKETGVKHYKFVATLDKRTSIQCRDMDGEIIPLSEAKAGVNYPPLHAYCRSTTIPYYVDDDEDSIVGERAARGEDGKTYYVPADTTYKEWAAKHAPPDATKPAAKTAPPQPTEPMPVKPVAPEPVVAPTELTKDEEAAVVRYIGGESYKLNDKLLRAVPLDPPEMAWVEQLDKAIDTFPTYQGDLTRSVYFSDPGAVKAFVKDIKPGAVLQSPQYISTTAGEIYNSAAQVIFYILSAQLGADVRGINEGEMEVLYGRNFPFKVVEIDVINGTYHILLEEMTNE